MSRFWLLVKQQQARKWSPLANTMKPEQKDKIHTLIFFVSCILGVLIIPSTNKFIFYLTRQQLNWIPSSSLLCIFCLCVFSSDFFLRMFLKTVIKGTVQIVVVSPALNWGHRCLAVEKAIPVRGLKVIQVTVSGWRCIECTAITFKKC